MSSRASTIATHSQDAATVPASKAADQYSVAADGPVKPEICPKDLADPGAFPEGGTVAWLPLFNPAAGGEYTTIVRPEKLLTDQTKATLVHMGYTKVGLSQLLLNLDERLDSSPHYLANETPSTISWIGSISIFLVSACSPFAGMLFDRGYFHHLTISGAVLQSFSLFMLSLTKRGQLYQIFLAQSFGCGIALGLMYVPSIAVLSHHFHRRRTLAMTLAAAGGSAGTIIHPIMLNNLIKKIGFTDGVRISAAFVGLILFIACLLMRTRLEPLTRPTNYWVVAKGAIRDLPFLIMTIGYGLFFTLWGLRLCGFYYPVFFLQLASVKHGNSLTFSFYAVRFSSMFATVLLTEPTRNLVSHNELRQLGFITPYTGVPKLMTIVTFCCGVAILGMIGLRSVASVVILGIFNGCFSGMYIALMMPLMTALTPDLSELGARMGISFMFVGTASLFGPPVSGALLTPQYKWWIPSLFSGLLMLAGGALFVVMQLVLARRDRATRRAKFYPERTEMSDVAALRKYVYIQKQTSYCYHNYALLQAHWSGLDVDENETGPIIGRKERRGDTVNADVAVQMTFSTVIRTVCFIWTDGWDWYGADKMLSGRQVSDVVDDTLLGRRKYADIEVCMCLVPAPNSGETFASRRDVTSKKPVKARGVRSSSSGVMKKEMRIIPDAYF
ncbi:major facilitator superfamily domain-containing protein [Scleroderma yunnanense]